MKTILVVDDSKTARLTLKRKLDLLNYQVEMADSGEAAIELLQQSAPPDLIFMDVLMGNMSGYEAAAEILKNPAMADVPIVMCTSKDSQEDRDEAARNGAKGFIIKPITDEAMERVLRELVIERVRAPAAAATTPTAAPSPAPAQVAPPVAAQAQFVITDELESLVRQMVEQANLQRAEEAAGQVVHAALGEHLHHVEDLLEGKLSILTSSLAALHSAQDQAQAEFQQALAAMPQANVAPENMLDEQRVSSLVSAQIKDFEAEEHSRRAVHELDFQSKLEAGLHGVAAQAAQEASERTLNQALGSHFVLMDEKLQTLSNELAALKSAPVQAAPSFAVDEQALFARVEILLEERMNSALPALLAAHADKQSNELAAHMDASEQKFQAIGAEIQAISAAMAAQPTQTAPTLPTELPADWLPQLLSKQDEMLEQRFNAWSAQMDAQLEETERRLFAQIDEKVDAITLQAASSPAAHAAPLASVGKAQQQAASDNKLALGLAVLGVALALIALFS
ncbi:MAG: response regulator [Pseudomonadota bacterium]